MSGNPSTPTRLRNVRSFQSLDILSSQADPSKSVPTFNLMHAPVPEHAECEDDVPQVRPKSKSVTSADVEMSWRLWVGIIAVSIGSSFQFGYGTGLYPMLTRMLLT